MKHLFDYLSAIAFQFVGWVEQGETQQYSKLNLLKAGYRSSTQPTATCYL